MTAKQDSREELIAAGFTRDSLKTSEASSYRCSGVTRDNGRPCRRLGHRLDEEGRRWCGTHGTDAHIKSPVPCAGLATDGKHCRKTADMITIVDGVDHTLCSFHDELYRDLGTIRTPGGYAKARHDARLAKAEEGEELKAAAELDESTVLDLLRARLTGLGVKTTKAVEGVIKDGLAAKKYINVTCKGCGKRSRHSIADISTRLATVKLIASELTPPETNGPVPSATSTSCPSITTAQLWSAANPNARVDPEFHRSSNLAAKVEWVAQIHDAGRPAGSSARSSSQKRRRRSATCRRSTSCWRRRGALLRQRAQRAMADPAQAPAASPTSS